MVDATNIACLETSVISTSLHCLRNYKFINYFIALVFYQSSENVQFSQHLIDNLTVSAFTQYKETFKWCNYFLVLLSPVTFWFCCFDVLKYKSLGNTIKLPNLNKIWQKFDFWSFLWRLILSRSFKASIHDHGIVNYFLDMKTEYFGGNCCTLWPLLIRIQVIWISYLAYNTQINVLPQQRWLD